MFIIIDIIAPFSQSLIDYTHVYEYLATLEPAITRYLILLLLLLIAPNSSADPITLIRCSRYLLNAHWLPTWLC